MNGNVRENCQFAESTSKNIYSLFQQLRLFFTEAKLTYCKTMDEMAFQKIHDTIQENIFVFDTIHFAVNKRAC